VVVVAALMFVDPTGSLVLTGLFGSWNFQNCERPWSWSFVVLEISSPGVVQSSPVLVF